MKTLTRIIPALLPMLTVLLSIGCAEPPGETVSTGRVSLAYPGELWHVDREITGMLTLKHGVDHPDAVARLYLSGWDADDTVDSFAELERRLRTSLAERRELEYLGETEELDEPLRGVSLSYRDRLGAEEYFNRDTLFYADGRYAVLELACDVGLEEELAADFELLRSTVSITEPPAPRQVSPGEELALDGLILTVAGDGWEVQEEETGLLLSRGDQRLHFYKRHPHTGTGEGFDLSDGLRREIGLLHREPDYLGEPRVRDGSLNSAAQAYQTARRWRYDAALLHGKSFYLVDAACPVDADRDIRDALRRMVDGIKAAQTGTGD